MTAVSRIGLDGGRKSRALVTVELSRVQSRVLLIAAKRLLADEVAMPRGPERSALEKAARIIERARG